MRIITTRKLRFYTKDRSENFVTSGNNIIEDCPDWIKEDRLFNLALRDRTLQVISSGRQQKVLENEKVLPQNAHEVKSELIESSQEVHMDNEEYEPEEDNMTEEESKKLKREKRKARKNKD